MQAAYHDTDYASIPHPYRNRRSASPSELPHSAQFGDVLYVIDENPHVREEFSSHFSALNMQVVTFANAAAYLAYKRRDAAACVILNVSLPDVSGLELQRRLVDHDNPPVIFFGESSDIVSTVSAMKAGAIDFLTRPFDMAALVNMVHAAFTHDRRQRQRKAELAELQERLSLLTPREREVFPLVLGGLLNKQAASILGISEVTLQIHRSQVIRKMKAESLAELVRMAMKLRLPYWRPQQEASHKLPTPPLFGVRDASSGLLQNGIR